MSINVSDAEMMLRCEDRGHKKNGIYSSLAGLLFPYLGTSRLESWMLKRYTIQIKPQKVEKSIKYLNNLPGLNNGMKTISKHFPAF